MTTLKRFKHSSNSVKGSESIPGNGQNALTESQPKIESLKAEIKILTERNNDILESISEAFFTLNKDWQFTYANHATELLLDCQPESLYGKSIWVKYPELIGSDFEPI